MEACGGAHYWAREIAKLGYEVRLMSPQFLRPYVGGVGQVVEKEPGRPVSESRS